MGEEVRWYVDGLLSLLIRRTTNLAPVKDSILKRHPLLVATHQPEYVR